MFDLFDDGNNNRMTEYIKVQNTCVCSYNKLPNVEQKPYLIKLKDHNYTNIY